MNEVTQEMGITESQVWAEIDAILEQEPPYVQEGDVTVKSYYLAHRDKFQTENAARNFLDRMVEDGRLLKIKCRGRDNNAPTMVYKPVTPAD